MKLKLIYAIRANGKQYRPPVVVDTAEIGITEADAEVLVRGGTAVVYDEPKKPAQQSTGVQLEEAAAPAPAKASRKR